jgi:hypothetical protein
MAHPGWADLLQVFEERKQAFIQEFGHRLITTPLPVDQRKLDEERGRWGGIREVLNEPARADRALRKEMEVRHQSG